MKYNNFLKIMKSHMGDDFVKQYLRYMKYKGWYEELLKLKKFQIPNSETDPIQWLIHTMDAKEGSIQGWYSFFNCMDYYEIKDYFSQDIIEKYLFKMKMQCGKKYTSIKKYL